ncbi:MAG: PAS domain-containing protein [Planctomycetota bacterium]|jgi:two-component system phosphate regulon sensor histidine kinase PhoR|nr:PAS domain-containing protein [Planctomycetota bacterium]
MGGVRIHIAVIAAVVLSGLAAMLPLAWSGAGILSSFYNEMTARELESGARLLALALPAGIDGKTREELGALVRAARAESHARYTLVRKDGIVVADSDEDAERMENHLNRPEIKAALAGETGVGTRLSPTLGADWLYVATKLADGNVIRAASAMEGLNKRLAQWWTKALALVAGSLAILLIMALVASHLISKPIADAAACAERYAGGDFSYRLPATGAAEMRRLAGSLNSMAGELDARFKLVDRQREEMRVVFDNMSEGVLAVDETGRVILVNGAARAILTLPENAYGSPIETLSRNADLLDAIRETASSDRPSEREIRVEHEAAREALVQVHTARIREDGRNAGVLAALRDVSRLRQLEIMRRDFVANVSHELRTPITAIQGSLETILDERPAGAEKIAEFVEMALRNTKRMGAIIDDLLFLAGMESGLGKEAEKVGVSSVLPAVNEAIVLCGEDARSRKNVIEVDCDANLTAVMNPRLVVHALVNLLDNAIKYGPEGGTIAVQVARDGDRVRITVSDQGPGIAPRHQSRVFERFYRMNGAPRVKKGSGLGLAIVKHIAIAQGGDIRLESEIGAGSRFILSLPGGK